MENLARIFSTFAERNDLRLAELIRQQEVADLSSAELDELTTRTERQLMLFKFKRARLGLETPDFL